jgi:hypothetical protein
VNSADYSLHVLLGIRLIDASPEFHTAVIQLPGPSAGTPLDPDIVIRTVDRLPVHGALRYIGLHRSAFDDRHFYAVDPLGRRIKVEFERLGAHSEFVCKRGMAAIPLLESVISLHLLTKGHVLLHASALVFEGRGVLVTGWEKRSRSPSGPCLTAQRMAADD